MSNEGRGKKPQGKSLMGADSKERRHAEKIYMESRPVICDKCGGKLFYDAMGRYRCENCKNEVLDDFGKVKVFLDENGPTPIPEIVEHTGVSMELLNVFLKKGRLEIPEGSRIYIKCERCGCSIRYGRYCPECMKELAGGITAVFNEDMGERPKREIKDDESGKMHFINRQK